MNVECLLRNCDQLRTGALVRGGGAVAHFECELSGERAAYLLPGDPLACLSASVDPADAESAGPVEEQSSVTEASE